jgi:hypothetical protein
MRELMGAPIMNKRSRAAETRLKITAGCGNDTPLSWLKVLAR